jgi:hypothetical protein
MTTCPISRPEIKAEAARSLNNLVNQIPRAHDLPSVIKSLNIITQVLRDNVVHNPPQVNNVYPTQLPQLQLQGEDHNPNYEQADWQESSRGYVQQTVVNPDDESQTVDIKTITQVLFTNVNDDSELLYQTPG